MKRYSLFMVILSLILVVGLTQGCSDKASPTEPSATTSTDTGTTTGTGSTNPGSTSGDTPATPPPSTPSVPVAYMTPDHIDFGTVLVGSNSTKSGIIENRGTATLNITSVSVLFTFNLLGLSCTSIPPGESCVYTIKFAPTTSGNKTENFKIGTNDPVNPIVTTTLSGTGFMIVLPPSL